jgi:hypothetical protein
VAITFSCACGATITVPDILAGHRGRCPGCEASLQAPGSAVLVEEGSGPAREPASATVRMVTVAPGGPLAKLTKSRLMLQFPCGGCQVMLLADPEHAGKRARCLHCKHVFVTPRTPGEAGAAPTPAGPAESAPPPPAPPLTGREAFRVVRLACRCGRQVSVPLARLREGTARCPSCDELLPRDAVGG